MTAEAQSAASTGHGDNGFTLIELVTVLMIFGVIAFIALPRFSGSESIAAPDRLVEWFRRQDERLRYQSARHQRQFAINIDAINRRIWITHSAMTSDEMDLAVMGGITLPDTLRIDRVLRPLAESEYGSENPVQIRYFPQGVSDMAKIVIREEGHTTRRIHIGPFLGISPHTQEDTP